MPASQRNKFTLDGEGLSKSKKVRLLSGTEDHPTYELPAGTYSFRVTAP